VLRLSPLDPAKFYTTRPHGSCRTICCGRLTARRLAVCGRIAPDPTPNFTHALIEQVVANTLAGRLDAARESLANFRKFQPGDRVSHLQSPHLPPSRYPEVSGGFAPGWTARSGSGLAAIGSQRFLSAQRVPERSLHRCNATIFMFFSAARHPFPHSKPPVGGGPPRGGPPWRGLGRRSPFR